MLDKFSGEVVARTALADAATVDAAISAAHGARAAMAAFPPDARRDVLDHCVRRFGERSEELALALPLYPRAEGVALDESPEPAPETRRPFADLAEMMKRKT